MAIDMETVARLLHIAAGVVWIGHLYFFNLTNLPVFAFKIANGDPAQKAGPNLMFRALWWFRWSAMATLLFGLWLLSYRVNASGMGYGEYLTSDGAGLNIFLGMTLGIVMWFNVWFIIWPNQKVVLGNNIKIAAGASPEEKATLEAANKPRGEKAKLASRINFWLSIPMLIFMVFAAHSPISL